MTIQRPLVLGAILALVVPACTPPTAPAAPGEPDERELEALEASMFEAVRTRDAEKLRAHVTADFVLRVPGESDVGREAFVASVLAIPGEILEVSGRDVRARRIGAVGVLTGTQSARVRLPDGTIVTDVRAFTDVCEVRDGRWRMVLAHSSPLAR